MCDIRYFKRALSLYKTAVREYQAGQADEYTMNTVASKLSYSSMFLWLLNG